MIILDNDDSEELQQHSGRGSNNVNSSDDHGTNGMLSNIDVNTGSVNHTSGAWNQPNCENLSMLLPKQDDWHLLPQEVREDLTAWFNVERPDVDDRALLAQLWHSGRFNAWDCPRCRDRVRSGAPTDWGPFQGADQPDFSSYPGSASYPDNERLCNTCRVYPNPENPEPELNELITQYRTDCRHFMEETDDES